MGYNKKVMLLFLNFFVGESKIQKGHCRFGHSFTKYNMAAKRNQAVKLSPTYCKKKCPILTG